MIAFVISHKTSQSREESTAGNRGHNPGGATLGVAAQATDREGEDGGEDARFEEEDQGKHSHSSLAVSAHRGGNEDHYTTHEDHEDPSGFDKHHSASGCEAAESKETLADGIAVGSLGCGDAGTFH